VPHQFKSRGNGVFARSEKKGSNIKRTINFLDKEIERIEKAIKALPKG
jgi:hypothetical protein